MSMVYTTFRCLFCKKHLTDTEVKFTRNQCAECHYHTIMGNRDVKNYNNWLLKVGR